MTYQGSTPETGELWKIDGCLSLILRGPDSSGRMTYIGVGSNEMKNVFIERHIWDRIPIKKLKVVRGSKGDPYRVRTFKTSDITTCTCTGYVMSRWPKSCRHVASL